MIYHGLGEIEQKYTESGLNVIHHDGECKGGSIPVIAVGKLPGIPGNLLKKLSMCECMCECMCRWDKAE